MQKIHLDTDIGGDIDDLCALAMVLQWPGVELTGVTTVAEHYEAAGQPPEAGRAGKRAGMVRYVLGLAGRLEVPVAAGADVSLPCYRMFQGLPDESIYWPEPIQPPSPHPFPLQMEGEKFSHITEKSPALDLLEHSIAQGAVIVAIGPYTNLAQLEQRSPGILASARLVLMGGYVYPPRRGYPAWGPEMDWNVQVDVGSALMVFEAAHRPTLVPLAVTVETALRRAYLPRLRGSGRLGKLIARQAQAHAVEYQNEATYGATCAGLPADVINFQHDPLACAIALGWDEGVETGELCVKSEIRDGWMRQAVDRRGKPVRLVTAIAGERFNEFWLERVVGGSYARPSQAGK